MFGKRKGLFVLLLSAALIITGCGANGNQEAGSASQESSGAAKSDELKSVRIGATSATAQLTESAQLAQELGYIDEELEKVGCKAEYVGFAGAGPAVNEAFAAGEIDYAFYADFPAITAKSNKVDLKVIGLGNSQMNYGLLVTEDSGIKKAEDMEGKKIIVTPGTILYKYFAELCEEKGVDINKVEIVNALTDAQTVLASGEADGLISALSNIKMYEAMGLGKVIVDSTDTPDATSGFVLAGRTKFVEENADVNKALLKALKRAAEYAEKNPEKVYDLLETETMTKEVLKETYQYDESFSYFKPELSDEYMARAEKIYNFAKENSLLGGEVDLKELFDSTYMDDID